MSLVATQYKDVKHIIKYFQCTHIFSTLLLTEHQYLICPFLQFLSFVAINETSLQIILWLMHLPTFPQFYNTSNQWFLYLITNKMILDCDMLTVPMKLRILR